MKFQLALGARDVNLDCGALMRTLCGGRGGGGKDYAEGVVEVETWEELVERFERLVKEKLA